MQGFKHYKQDRAISSMYLKVETVNINFRLNVLTLCSLYYIALI